MLLGEGEGSVIRVMGHSYEGSWGKKKMGKEGGWLRDDTYLGFLGGMEVGGLEKEGYCLCMQGVGSAWL